MVLTFVCILYYLESFKIFSHIDSYLLVLGAALTLRYFQISPSSYDVQPLWATTAPKVKQTNNKKKNQKTKLASGLSNHCNLLTHNCSQ